MGDTPDLLYPILCIQPSDTTSSLLFMTQLQLGNGPCIPKVTLHLQYRQPFAATYPGGFQGLAHTSVAGRLRECIVELP